MLLPLALIGLLTLPRRRDAILLAGFVLATPAVYAWFWVTPQHPRYFYASLPALLILCGAGLAALFDAAVSKRRDARPRPAGS